MTEHSLWRFSRALHRAINERQFDELEALLDDDVDWAIYGPIDMFPFLGARRGKAAVLEVIRQIADNVRVHRFDREIDHAGRGFGRLDDALFADRAGFQQADQAADRAFRPVQGRPADAASACWSTRFDLVEQALGPSDPSAEDRVGRLIDPLRRWPPTAIQRLPVACRKIARRGSRRMRASARAAR